MEAAGLANTQSAYTCMNMCVCVSVCVDLVHVYTLHSPKMTLCLLSHENAFLPPFQKPKVFLAIISRHSVHVVIAQ